VWGHCSGSRLPFGSRQGCILLSFVMSDRSIADVVLSDLLDQVLLQLFFGALCDAWCA
jgi:hypothetical protein